MKVIFEENPEVVNSGVCKYISKIIQVLLF